MYLSRIGRFKNRLGGYNKVSARYKLKQQNGLQQQVFSEFMIRAIDQTQRVPARAANAGTPRRDSPENCLFYCILVAFLPLLAVPSLIKLGSSDFFLHHGASVWVRSNDAVFDMRDRECDVLVYGDSTAMTGINPEVVESNTGFRTCNIAVTNAVLAVTNNLTLDHFLAHNARPNVILVQLSPDGFQSENHAWRKTIYAEGMLELLRHGRPGEARRVMVSHPQESIAFAGYAAGFTAWYAIKEVWTHATSITPEEDMVQVQGRLLYAALARADLLCAGFFGGFACGPHQGDFSRLLVSDYKHGYSARGRGWCW